jgi:putative ABC transport system permease protein
MSGGRWTIAIRSLSRNKRRNIATGIAIAFGFAAFVILGGYVNRAENFLRVYTLYVMRVGHINVYKKDGLDQFSADPKNYSLTATDLATLRRVANELGHLDMHGPQLQGMGLMGNGCRAMPFWAIGIDPEIDRWLRQNKELKRWAPRLQGFLRGTGIWNYTHSSISPIAISDGLAQLLNKPKVYDDIPKDQPVTLLTDCQSEGAKEVIASDSNVQIVAGTWQGNMSALDGEIVSQFNPGVSELRYSAMVAPLNFMQKLYDTENASIYTIWLRDERKVQSTIKLLETRLAKEGLGVDIYPWTNETIAPFYNGTLQFLYTMVTFIACVLALIIVLSIFNSATMTVIERSQEIGMMRSLGFTRRHILELFVAEGLALAALSVVVGGAVAILGSVFVSSLGIEVNPPGVAGGMPLVIEPTTLQVVVAAVFTLTLALATTVAAVRTVVKQKIPNLLMGTNQ